MGQDPKLRKGGLTGHTCCCPSGIHALIQLPSSMVHQSQSLLFSCESCLHNPWVSLQMIAFCFLFRFYTASLFGIRVGLHSVFNMSREVVTQQLSNNIQLKATTETEVKPIYIQLAEE